MQWPSERSQDEHDYPAHYRGQLEAVLTEYAAAPWAPGAVRSLKTLLASRLSAQKRDEAGGDVTTQPSRLGHEDIAAHLDDEGLDEAAHACPRERR